MSDEVAAKRTQEEAEAKKKLEEAKARMEVIQLMRDPVLGGQTVIVPVQNIDKQWQIELMVNQAKSQTDVEKLSRTLIGLLSNLGAITTKKKGLFKR